MTGVIDRAKMQVMSDADAEQAAARRYVAEILRATGWSPTALARKAGLTPSTVTRFLNSEVGHTLSSRSIGKITQAASAIIPRDQLDALWLISRRVPANGGGPNSSAHQ